MSVSGLFIQPVSPILGFNSIGMTWQETDFEPLRHKCSYYFYFTVFLQEMLSYFLMQGGLLVDVIRGANSPQLQKKMIYQLAYEHKVLEGQAERKEVGFSLEQVSSFLFSNKSIVCHLGLILHVFFAEHCIIQPWHAGFLTIQCWLLNQIKGPTCFSNHPISWESRFCQGLVLQYFVLMKTKGNFLYNL